MIHFYDAQLLNMPDTDIADYESTNASWVDIIGYYPRECHGKKSVASPPGEKSFCLFLFLDLRPWGLQVIFSISVGLKFDNLGCFAKKSYF